MYRRPDDLNDLKQIEELKLEICLHFKIKNLLQPEKALKIKKFYELFHKCKIIGSKHSRIKYPEHYFKK